MGVAFLAPCDFVFSQSRAVIHFTGLRGTVWINSSHRMLIDSVNVACTAFKWDYLSVKVAGETSY